MENQCPHLVWFRISNWSSVLIIIFSRMGGKVVSPSSNISYFKLPTLEGNTWPLIQQFFFELILMCHSLMNTLSAGSNLGSLHYITSCLNFLLHYIFSMSRFLGNNSLSGTLPSNKSSSLLIMYVICTFFINFSLTGIQNVT